ncbi:MAG: DsbA family protein [Candidatus Dormibacteraeota bacterium]|nr:DsbA family protein [Candidatus Dormibacteraeota bacterium]MBV8445771.1 DsbA family protein [Candidatus Dormibacteraeota bacterium]
MADRIRFYFDPRCPWSFQTARWVRRLEQVGVVEVAWSVFSLDIVNQRDGAAAPPDSGGAPALRTALVVRQSHGERAVGAFYEALGTAVHIDRRTVDDPSVIEDALRSAGSDPGTLRRAMADAATWEAVKAEHDSAVNDKGAFGVPTIALDGGDGPAIFGPIVCDLPDDESARELWSHVRWLIANDSFAELKRGRPRRPDFAKHGGGDTARAA